MGLVPPPPPPRRWPQPRPGEVIVHGENVTIDVRGPDPCVACDYCGNVYAAMPANGCDGCGARAWRPARLVFHAFGRGELKPSDFVLLKG